MKDVSVPHLLGALLGAALGLLFADLVDQRAADQRATRAWLFLHRMVDLGFPYLGLVIGARRGRVAGAVPADHAVPGGRPAAALQAARHERHHRRPRRRHLRDRVPRRHAGRAAVRAEGTPADRRLERHAQAQPRPPRPRHPPEDPEDGRRRGGGVGPRLPGDPGGRPQADRARPRRCRGRSSPTTSTSTRSRSCAASRCSTSTSSPNAMKPVVLPGRDHEGLHPEGRQGIQPGRRVPRRRHDGRRRQRAQDDQQDHRHRRHERAADHGRQDDLRPAHRAGHGARRGARP